MGGLAILSPKGGGWGLGTAMTQPASSESALLPLLLYPVNTAVLVSGKSVLFLPPLALPYNQSIMQIPNASL